jgi:ArsR family transcriptional regulator, lead/cadmium/zinc/bismuth-responsive transcriptional repressor
VLAERARALSDPTRLTLAAALGATDELCVCDLAWVSERAENLVSHHLRALRAAGLVSSRREGKMVMYSLTAAGRSLLGAVLDRTRVPA